MKSTIWWQAHFVNVVKNTVFVFCKVFFICVCGNLNCFFKNWLWFVTINLPSVCSIVFSEQLNVKNRMLLFFVQPPKKVTWQCPKKEGSSSSGTWTWNWPYKETSHDSERKEACISNKLHLQKHSAILLHEIKSLRSATSIPSRSHLAYNTTVS